MKMKRYVAADMRSALKAIRDEQGPDAVILSTRHSSQGVEVCAAVDIELAASQGSLGETAALKQLERAAMAELERSATEAAAAAAATPVRLVSQNAAPVALTRMAPETLDDDGLLLAALNHGLDGETNRSVGAELRSLRSLLEQQLAALAWNDFTRREPLKARALADLASLGLDRGLALRLVGDLPAGLADDQVQRMPYAMLARRIQVSAAALPVHGALMLIGPSGSGKTTTLSKLAARYVLEHDAANLVILSTDDERLGSHEQLRSLGRLLGVRVEAVKSGEELAARIAALPGRCILIDSPGVAPRDTHAAGAYRALRERCPTLQTMLVIPASAQAGVIEETVEHFGPGIANCCVVTRIDEAVTLGGVLSVLARSLLPVAYCCEGPRIPDDLKPARAHQLVARAVELARQAPSSADDDLLARRYGGSVNAAA